MRSVAVDDRTACHGLGTAVGTGVDGSIQSMQYTYDSLGRREKITSYSDNDCTTAVNEVVYTYNQFGALDKEYQEHDGQKDDSTLYVQYNYSTSVDTGVYDEGARPVSVRYPDARVVFYDYGAADGI